MSNDVIALSIQQAKELIKAKYRQFVSNPEERLRPLYMEAHAGVGKTQSVRQAAEELSRELGKPVECKVLNLQFCERPDLMGLAFVKENRTVFAQPTILPTEGFGILFLDEANRVDKEVRSSMLTLLEDRSINGHALGKFWMPVLAGNPNTDKYEVSDFDTALSDRVAKVSIKADVQALTRYLESKYEGHFLVDVLKRNPRFVSFEGSGVTPRTLEYAIRSTKHYEKMDKELLFQTLCSEIGVKAATSALALDTSEKIPTYQDVLSGSRESFIFINQNQDRGDIISSISRQLSEDLKSRAQTDKPFAESERKYIHAYLKVIREVRSPL